MVKKIVLILVLVVSSNSILAQDIFGLKELLGHNLNVYGIKTKQFSKKLDAGNILEIKEEKVINGVKTLIINRSTIKNDTTIRYDSTYVELIEWVTNNGHETKLKPGFGNLYTKSGDGNENKLFINWWRFNQDKNYYEDRYSEYYIEFKDRGSEFIRYQSIVLSAITIPFKYRMSFSENNIFVPSIMEASLNASVSIGYAFGKTFYYYEKYNGIKANRYSFIPMAFAGPTIVTLDNSNTTTSVTPFTDRKETTGVLSTGIGFIFNFQGFHSGFFVGTDFAFGESKKDWDHHKKIWTGFGFGYSTGLDAIGKALKFGS